MLGAAALAMWWDMAPAMRREFEHWHTHEHFPERLSLPGFLRASRWADAQGGEGFFVLYELREHAALSSPEYLARLNAPTAWSRQLMPHHANMVRSQCVVLAGSGGVAARHALTLRFSPGGDHASVRDELARLCGRVAGLPGLCGAHLLRTQAPAIAPTVEQRIRGDADREADWIFIATGWDAGALEGIEHPALAQGTRGLYGLSAALAADDVR